MATVFTTPYNYDPNVTRLAVASEAHTIPASAPYTVHLQHIPRRQDPETIAVSGYTRVAPGIAPAAGEFSVDYTNADGDPVDTVQFNAADARKSVTFAYNACGTIIYAQELISGDGRTNLLQLIQAINAIEDDYGTASGLATLNATAKVLQRLAYEGVALGVATLDASGNLVQPVPDGSITPAKLDLSTRSGFLAYKTVSGPIAAATVTKILFDTEVYDNQNEYDPAASRFAVTEPGIYLVAASVDLNAPSAGNQYFIAAYVNGVEEARLDQGVSGGAKALIPAGATPLELAAGDFVEIYAFCETAVSAAVGQSVSRFSAIRVA